MVGRFGGRAAVLTTALLLAVAVACGAAAGAPQGSAPQQAPAQAAPAPLRDLTIAVSSVSASNIVQYVGIDHGFYEKYGFRVHVQQMRSSVTPAALVSGQVDYSTGVDSALRVAATGMPIKVVAVDKRAPTFGMIVRPEIERLQDLKGKVVGTSTVGGSNYYALKRTLEAYGMSIQDVQVLVVGDSPVQLQNLLQGTIDATPLSAPAVFQALDQGYQMLVYIPDRVTFASTGLIASDEAIQSHPEEVKKLIVAHVEIIQFIKDHKDAAVEVLARQFDIPTELAAKTYDFEIPAYSTDPRMSPDDVEATVREELAAGHLSERVPLERMVAVGLIEEALAQRR